jgi:hypothetical protein
MAKPFTFSTKRAGGNIYVQFALPDGGRTFQKSTGTSNRKEHVQNSGINILKEL